MSEQSCVRHLPTFDAVVEALGGAREVGRITKQNTAAVCNWRRRRSRFPTKYYKIMRRRLEARGASAPDQLWGMEEEDDDVDAGLTGQDQDAAAGRAVVDQPD